MLVGPSCICELTRKARKPHKCCECGCEIKKGDHYAYTSGVWDGQGQDFKQCPWCNDLQTAFVATCRDSDEYPPFGELRPYILESRPQHENYNNDGIDWLVNIAKLLEVEPKTLNEKLLKQDDLRRYYEQNN